MGTDIHVICQVKENGVWKDNTSKVFRNPWFEDYKQWILNAKNEGNQQKAEYWTNRLNEEGEFLTYPDDNRSYDWFSVIGNVRNGYGFAGVKTGMGFAFISDSKGFPEDFEIDEYYRHNGKWMGDHSYTYLTLSEFENFDWNQVTMKTGVITLDQYKDLRETNGVPETYCSSIGGPDIQTVDTQTADAILGGKMSLKGNIHVQYYWPVVYREWFDYKLRNWLEPMKILKQQYEDVRVVFGFDS